MSAATWRLPVTLIALLLGLSAAACARGGRFDVGNARAHVERLASGGSRAAGTTANEKARAYLIETLQLYGYEVRLQETDASWPEAGATTRVANVIAIRPGSERDAIGLVSHYDSVAWGPGAGDDALGTAVVLEAARVLAARPSPRYTLMVLFTDGEEHGLMGARALVGDPEVRARLRTFVNVEAIGTDLPFVLFETGPGTSPALWAWAGASRPRGGSYMQSIYDALPNDTDFSVLKTLPGVSGINFAATGDGYTYHTDRDRADRVTDRVLARAGDLVLDVAEGLDTRASLAPLPTSSMYFSLLDRAAFIVSMRAGILAGWVSAVLGLLAWLLVARALVQAGGLRQVLATAVWAVVASAAVLAALVAAVWLVRAGRAELHPWFASPWRLFAFMTTMVVTVSWLVRRIAAATPPAFRPDGTPYGVWFTALPPWIGLNVASLLYAPAASYLAWLPLLAAVLLVTPTLVFAGATPPLRTWPARLASAATAVVAWTLWGPDLTALLSFAVTLLGRLPLVTPTPAFPAVFFLAGIVLWPPVLAVLIGRVRWRMGHGIAAGTLMFALVVTGLLAWMAPAFTDERPQQRSAVFVDDRVRHTAHWELFGNEPGVDIGPGAPANVAWQVADRSSVPGVQVAPKAHMFRGGVAVPDTPAPATVSATLTRGDGDADVEITVTPAAGWRALAIVLPESVVPLKSSLVGRTRGGRWQAWHTTVPAEGLTWRATIPAGQADRIDRAEVWVSRVDLPGASNDARVPAWLQAPHTAWMTQHVVMLPVTANQVQRVPEPLAPLALPLPSANPATAAPLQPAARPTPGGRQ